jgi:hypothetical protein
MAEKKQKIGTSLQSLFLACENGYLHRVKELVPELIKQGISLNEYIEYNNFTHKIKQEDTKYDSVLSYISGKISKNMHCNSICDSLWRKIIKYLVENGVNVNAKSPDTGLTALHCAFKYNRRCIIPILLDCGANPWLKNNERDTPMKCIIEGAKDNAYEMYETMSMFVDCLEEKYNTR